jgi:hypothetical protein
MADFSLEVSYMLLDCAAWEVLGEGDARLACYLNLWHFADSLCRLESDYVTNHVNDKPRQYTPNRTADIDTTFFLDSQPPTASSGNAVAAARNRRPHRVLFVSARRVVGA